MIDDPAKKALAIAHDATGKNNLPMDQKSRLKRARAMGFDTKKVYYHGTDQDIKQFDPVSPQGHFGVYISKDPMIADVYATKNQYNEPPAYGGNIMPLYAKKNAPIQTNQMAGYYKVNHPSELRSIHADFDPNEINNLDIMKSNGGMIDDPAKSIRRAVMVAKGLAKEIGPLPTGEHPKPPHPASMIPGVHVTGMGDEHTAIPDGYADGGDVEPTDETGFDAWHGTPHTFDRFDLAHIGQGEGVQAYGHGMYFAGDEGIARSYRSKLSGNPSQVVFPSGDKDEWGQPIRFHPDELENRAERDAARALLNTGDYNKGRDRLLYLKQNAERKDAAQAMRMIRRGDIKEATPGHLYHVRVNANPEHFLDWDKPLSEQHPRVQSALAGVTDLESIKFGGDAYQALANQMADKKGRGNFAGASAALHAAGIPGIRYLDANSRGSTGNPTHNHVIFDPSIIDIKHRYARGGDVAHFSDSGGSGDDQTVHKALTLTNKINMSVPQQTDPMQYQGAGLQFPEQESSARLALKLKRQQAVNASGAPKNPRTIIRAPLATENKKQLPDFVAGDINYDDWKTRHESILNPEEIHQSSKWYKNVQQSFMKYYPNDPALANKMMRAWLVAQQNVSPAGAMNNVLMQREQASRGVPEDQWTAGGMPNPTAAARAVLKNQLIEGGVGQKIADFVDSAEQKPVRSWMGNHPNGGEPFVVDVHTARDTGMVDEELKNHLARLGYNKNDLNKIGIDLKGSPTEAAYENRAEFGRGLTKHLNAIKWQGRGDWTPAEVQAVGWMGMTKLTRNAEEDSESGLSRNLRRLSFETAPGAGSPWEKKYGAAFNALSSDAQRSITHAMNGSALERAAKMAGIHIRDVVHGTGAWDNDQNPATVGQSLMTQKGGDIAANALGYLLNQTEVWHNRIKPLGGTTNPKGFAVDFVQNNGNDFADPEKLKQFWQSVQAADHHNIVRGYQPIRLPSGQVGIRALIDQGGLKTKEKIEDLLRHADPESQDIRLQKAGALQQLVQGSNLDLHAIGHEAEISRAANDWKKDAHGQAYLARLVNLLGTNPQPELDHHRGELEAQFERHLDEAHAQQGTPDWRKITQTPTQKIIKADGGDVENPIVSRALDLTRGINEPSNASASSTRDSQTGPQAGELRGQRGIRGSESFLPASGQASGASLEGLPANVKIPATGQIIVASHDPRIRAVAAGYMKSAGLPYNPPTKYAKANPERAGRIAQAYSDMKHEPGHPLVKASYAALVRETLAQYQAAKRAGFKAEFWNPATERNPYEASPRLAIEDVQKNHHMFVYPTHAGYGTEPISAKEIEENPMLANSGEHWNGQPATVNDIFRAVHDYYGHAKEGVGFRADGEENAWRSHAAMFSPLARLALTNETRGQNSWVNYGPHGEKNRSAKTENTTFADQKMGVMPAWVNHEGAEDFTSPQDIKSMHDIYKQYGRANGGSAYGMNDNIVTHALSIARNAIKR